ncbi:MAG: response regulator [Pyrinomonadaceae bacterium]
MTDQNLTGAKTILVVDDFSDNLVLVSLWLQSKGYRVLSAENGARAIEIAALARPDLIIMDIHMPELDGFGATRRIRQRAELKTVPVIALTAFSTEGFQKAAIDAGIDGYLNKPIDFPKLENLISRLLQES